MLEIYSKSIDVDANAAIPLNNTSIIKGCTAVLTSPSTIQLNKKGVYMVSCNTSCTAASDANVSIQLYKNGTPQLQAGNEATGATETAVPLSFTTLVQVPEDNSCSCYSIPTTIQIMNTGAAATHDINVCVTKLC